MKKGEIVLIQFPFTDLVGSKLRPALILIVNNKDVTVSFITSQVGWKDETDIILEANPENGLKKTSLIRLSKLATIDKSLVSGKLGQLKNEEITLVNDNLKILFKL